MPDPQDIQLDVDIVPSSMTTEGLAAKIKADIEAMVAHSFHSVEPDAETMRKVVTASLQPYIDSGAVHSIEVAGVQMQTVISASMLRTGEVCITYQREDGTHRTEWPRYIDVGFDQWVCVRRYGPRRRIKAAIRRLLNKQVAFADINMVPAKPINYISFTFVADKNIQGEGNE